MGAPFSETVAKLVTNLRPLLNRNGLDGKVIDRWVSAAKTLLLPVIGRLGRQVTDEEYVERVLSAFEVCLDIATLDSATRQQVADIALFDFLCANDTKHFVDHANSMVTCLERHGWNKWDAARVVSDCLEALDHWRDLGSAVVCGQDAVHSFIEATCTKLEPYRKESRLVRTASVERRETIRSIFYGVDCGVPHRQSTQEERAEVEAEALLREQEQLRREELLQQQEQLKQQTVRWLHAVAEKHVPGELRELQARVSAHEAFLEDQSPQAPKYRQQRGKRTRKPLDKAHNNFNTKFAAVVDKEIEAVSKEHTHMNAVEGLAEKLIEVQSRVRLAQEARAREERRLIDEATVLSMEREALKQRSSEIRKTNWSYFILGLVTLGLVLFVSTALWPATTTSNFSASVSACESPPMTVPAPTPAIVAAPPSVAPDRARTTDSRSVDERDPPRFLLPKLRADVLEASGINQPTRTARREWRQAARDRRERVVAVDQLRASLSQLAAEQRESEANLLRQFAAQVAAARIEQQAQDDQDWEELAKKMIEHALVERQHTGSLSLARANAQVDALVAIEARSVEMTRGTLDEPTAPAEVRQAPQALPETREQSAQDTFEQSPAPASEPLPEQLQLAPPAETTTPLE